MNSTAAVYILYGRVITLFIYSIWPPKNCSIEREINVKISFLDAWCQLILKTGGRFQCSF